MKLPQVYIAAPPEPLFFWMDDTIEGELWFNAQRYEAAQQIWKAATSLNEQLASEIATSTISNTCNFAELLYTQHDAHEGNEREYDCNERNNFAGNASGEILFSDGTADDGIMNLLDAHLPDESIGEADERICRLVSQLCTTNWPSAVHELYNVHMDDLLAHAQLTSLLERLARCACVTYSPEETQSSHTTDSVVPPADAARGFFSKLCSSCASEPLPEQLLNAYASLCIALANSSSLHVQNASYALLSMLESSLVDIGLHWIDDSCIQHACFARAQLALSSGSKVADATWLDMWCGSRSGARALRYVADNYVDALPINEWLKNATTPNSNCTAMEFCYSCQYLARLFRHGDTASIVSQGNYSAQADQNVSILLMLSRKVENLQATSYYEEMLSVADACLTCALATSISLQLQGGSEDKTIILDALLNVLSVHGRHGNACSGRFSFTELHTLLPHILETEAFMQACFDPQCYAKAAGLLNHLIDHGLNACVEDLILSSRIRAAVRACYYFVGSLASSSSAPLNRISQPSFILTAYPDFFNACAPDSYFSSSTRQYHDVTSMPAKEIAAYVCQCDASAGKSTHQLLWDIHDQLRENIEEGRIHFAMLQESRRSETTLAMINLWQALLLARNAAKWFVHNVPEWIGEAFKACKAPTLTTKPLLTMLGIRSAFGLANLELLTKTNMELLVSELEEARDSLKANAGTRIMSYELELGLDWLNGLHNALSSLNRIDLSPNETETTSLNLENINLKFGMNDDQSVNIFKLQQAWCQILEREMEKTALNEHGKDKSTSASSSTGDCIAFLSRYCDCIRQFAEEIRILHGQSCRDYFDWRAVLLPLLLRGSSVKPTFWGCLLNADSGLSQSKMQHAAFLADCLIEEEIPSVAGCFKQSGVPLQLLLRRWLESIFLGIVPAPEAAQLYTLATLWGREVIVACLCIIIEHLKDSIMQLNASGELPNGILQLYAKYFKLGKHMERFCCLRVKVSKLPAVQ